MGIDMSWRKAVLRRETVGLPCHVNTVAQVNDITRGANIEVPE